MSHPPPSSPTKNLVPADSYSSDVTAVHADETGLLDDHPSPHVNGTPSSLHPQGQGTPSTDPIQTVNSPKPDTPSHIQFAILPSDEKSPNLNDKQPSSQESNVQQWVPIPLRTWFWLPLLIFMVLGGIILLVLLRVTNDRKGWATAEAFSDTGNVLHYVYTIPPVAIAMFLVAMLVWTDLEIKKLQPYVDLVHGNSPPDRSLLLDYSRTSNFFVWMHAIRNRHFVVALATLMGLLALTFQPLAAALLVTKDVYWMAPDQTLKNQFALGLNWNPEFMDLTSFLTASGYASASVLYDLADPPFVSKTWTVGEFELPNYQGFNGTVEANTTAIKSEPNCGAPDSLNMTQNTTGSGWIVSASANSCSFTWSVDTNATSLFGTNVADCGGNYANAPVQFRPVIFWIFTYQPSAKASATFCFPNITLWDVTADVDIVSGNLLNVTTIRPFNSSNSQYSEYANNITGPPLNGQAYNGIEFNLTNPNEFVLSRRDAIQLQMPAAMFQSASQSSGGLDAVFDANAFPQLATQVYTTYLVLIAKMVYFLPSSDPINVSVKSATKRLFLSPLAVYFLATVMFIIAIGLALVQYFHRLDRKDLRLAHEPGTIASAVSIGAQTDAAFLLDGVNRAQDIRGVLRGKKFRIDAQTMKIVLDGEEGYEEAKTPDPRGSMFGKLGLGRMDSKRISKFLSEIPKSPVSAHSPVSPQPPKTE